MNADYLLDGKVAPCSSAQPANLFSFFQKPRASTGAWKSAEHTFATGHALVLHRFSSALTSFEAADDTSPDGIT
ncbi:unnamed protein product [Lasius platythorax]|uniref:Uncharacterized protein n=1 Tax=Lasius platythorax TaxID=488582 RepID=A0AAV2MZ66_9HYME